MKKYKILSFDVFQTLVNVNERIPQIWQGVYGAEYSEEKAMEGASAIFKCLPGAYNRAMGEKFHTMEELYIDCAEGVAKMLGLSVHRAEDITFNLIEQHAFAPFYKDVLPEMDYFRRNFAVIISSDSNHQMVDRILEGLDYDRAFISDDLRCYKAEPDGRFFRKVLNEVDALPEEILHIGDTSADVVGAKAVGIAACWINRERREWRHEVKPDYVVESFKELREMLQG